MGEVRFWTPPSQIIAMKAFEGGQLLDASVADHSCEGVPSQIIAMRASDEGGPFLDASVADHSYEGVWARSALGRPFRRS